MNRNPPPARLRSSRRSSFARRDSNLALLGALLSGVVLAFALLLLVVQRINPDQGARLRGATLDALSPIISVARAPADAVRWLSSGIAAHWRVVETNRTLKRDLAAARARVARTDALALELARMEKLIALRRPERRLVASGVASASAASAGLRSAIISAGLADGVRPRMPVIAAEGLAGRVVDVGNGAARVMLLTDANSRVPVKVIRTGWTGLAMGTGGTLLDFSYDVASGADRIRVGDRLVTSGDGGLFPPGVPVAVIIDIGQNPPKARPLANPTGLGAVTVEAPWLPAPVFVPTAPAPSEPDRIVAAAVAPVAPVAPATSAASAASGAPAALGAQPAGPQGAPPAGAARPPQAPRP
jgi:rod shape-determining protein MreC